jgi:hypothetical protein
MLSKIFPQVYLVYLLLAVLGLGGVYLKGRIDGRAVCDDRIAVIQAESVQRERAAQDRAVQASAELEAVRGKTEVKYRTITKQVEKIIDRPIYSNVCLDADGLRLANAALSRKALTSEPLDALPGPTATP